MKYVLCVKLERIDAIANSLEHAKELADDIRAQHNIKDGTIETIIAVPIVDDKFNVPSDPNSWASVDV